MTFTVPSIGVSRIASVITSLSGYLQRVAAVRDEKVNILATAGALIGIGLMLSVALWMLGTGALALLQILQL